MKTIKKETAIKTSSAWHGGQWSPLYQFASSGIFLPEQSKQYLNDIQRCLETEYYLHPVELSKKDRSDLTKLKTYFKEESKKHGITFAEYRHKIYGYILFQAMTNANNIVISEPNYMN